MKKKNLITLCTLFISWMVSGSRGWCGTSSVCGGAAAALGWRRMRFLAVHHAELVVHSDVLGGGVTMVKSMSKATAEM